MDSSAEDNGFMTHQEMQDHFPGRKGLELVVLTEHDGDHMWKREPDGWHRLSGASDGAA